MRNILILLVLSLSAMLSSCADHASVPPLLVQADSAYMRGDYEQADSLLEAYESAVYVENEKTSMYHQLVRMEQLFVDDSINEQHFNLIDSLQRYYTKTDYRENNVKAILFLGCAYDAVGDSPSAMKYYLKAVEIAEKEKFQGLAGLVYKKLGELYFSQKMYEEGSKCHRRSLEIAQAHHDTLRIVHAAMNMGIVFTAENKVDSILHTYFYMLDMMKAFPHRHFSLSVVYWHINDIYIQIGEYEKALLYMTRDSFYDENWAYWYYGQGKQDSAIYYFERVLEHSSLYGMQEILPLLAKLEKNKGNYVKALNYMEDLHQVEDSIRKVSRADEMRKVEARHHLNIVKQERDELEQRQRIMIVFLCSVMVISVLSFVAIYYIWRTYRKEKEEQLLQERFLRKEEEKKSRQGKEQIERNNEKIAELKQQLLEAKLANDDTTISKLTLSTQLLQAENENIKTTQIHQQLKKEQLEIAPIILRIRKCSGKTDFHLSEEEWRQVSQLIDKTYEDFTLRLLSIAKLSSNELRICYLVKLDIPSAHIAVMLYRSKSAITMARQRMCLKLMKKKGSSTQFTTFIQAF